MTAKTSRLKSEIEKCRTEGLWTKTSELVRQLSAKNPGLDYYVHFILGESDLEVFANEHTSTEQAALSASDQQKLDEAERHLKVVLKENGNLHLEATLLQAKVHFYRSSYQSALTLYEQANLDTITVTSSSPRMLHIIAEAYAIKGLCLEKLPASTTSKFKAREREEKILASYEMAGDLCLLYLQEKEKALQSSYQVEPEDSSVGDILETAIQQSPLYYIKHGELDKGIKRFRDLLSAVESRYTQHLRLTLARQLAEVLLRGVCESSYLQPDPVSKNNNQAKGMALSPRKYTAMDKLFIPGNQTEETLLLLLIAEAVATREAVLSRSVEHKEVRLHTFHNAAAVYDLLAITLVKRAQFHKLVDSFERAMKFSFEEYHIWHQFANSLICDRQYERALLALKECHRLKPKLVIPLLQAAKLCYENLHKYDEGIEFAKLALEAGDDHPASSRAHVALGIGYSLKAAEMKLKGDRQNLHNQALRAFQKAHVLDPNDYLSLFHLALQLAVLRQIEDAMKYTKLALKYYSDHIHSLHLLVLLLTAQKQYQDAMDLVSASLEEYPDNISLLFTKCKIEEMLLGSEVALNTCKKMMKLWKRLNEIQDDGSDRCSFHGHQRVMNTMDRSQFDRKSNAHLQLNELPETGSIRAESLAVSRIEQTLSDLASSSIGEVAGQSVQGSRTLRLQGQIWMTLSDLYLSVDKVEEAESCVREASTLFPLSHQVAYMRGRIYEHKNKFRDAKEFFESAVSLNPFHTKSLQHLGMVLHYLDNNKLAEKVLRDAVNTDPTSDKSWYCLGVVLEALGQSEASVSCQVTALDLEATSPIVPFIVIPRLMH